MIPFFMVQQHRPPRNTLLNFTTGVAEISHVTAQEMLNWRAGTHIHIGSCVCIILYIYKISISL